MAAYLKHTLLNFGNLQFQMEDVEGLGVLETYNVSDYTSMDFAKLRTFIDSLPSTMFNWMQLQDNVALEKVAYDLYGNADYWDIIVLVNARRPLFEMPYGFDTITTITEQRVAGYVADVYGTDLGTDTYNAMYAAYEKQLSEDVEKWRVIKVVKPERVQEFLQRGYEEGLFV